MPAANLTKIPKPQNDAWVLRLYVAGQTPKSVTAFANLKKICAEHLADKYSMSFDRYCWRIPNWRGAIK